MTSDGLKTCSKCAVAKPRSEFHVRNRVKGYLKSHCKECVSAAMKDYYADNREVRHTRAVETRRPGYGREHYWANREARLKQNAEWYAKNPERNAAKHAARKLREALPDEDREISVAYRMAIASDPCQYCGEIAEIMHVDHATPLSRGGTDHWWNLVRSCSSCNLRKGAKTAAEFCAFDFEKEGMMNV